MNKFTGNTRLFLCISGAIIVIALVMQIAGVGLNLGIDFTGGSILNYSVGENYDSNDVETILNASGYTDNQVTKAAPSAASRALQAELAAAAEKAAEEATEEVAEAAEEATEEVAEAAEEATEEAAEPVASLLNLDKSGINADGLTDLQIRLKLADATAGMEDAVKAAVTGVVSGATETSYRNATNLEISNLGYELTYAGGNIIEYNMGGDFDKEAVQAAVTKALEEGGYSVNAIQFVKYDAEAEAARLAEAETAAAAEAEAAEAETEEAEVEEAETEETDAEGETPAPDENAEVEEGDPEVVEETGSNLRILVDMDDVTSQVRAQLEREMTEIGRAHV